QGLRGQEHLGLLYFSGLRPGERARFQPLGHQPQPSAIEVEHFQPRVPFVAEDKKSAAFDVLLEPVTDQPSEPFEALAHVARLQRHKDLQTAGEAQHGTWGVRAAMSCAASGTCEASVRTRCTPPGSDTFNAQ